MLRPTIKEPSVNESERILAKIASRTFFSLWCYPSLFRSVGKGKELADLTIYFNKTIILFSDKGEVKYQSHNETGLAWSRWYRGAVKESAKQLHAAEKFIRTNPDKIFLNSKLEDRFPFDLSDPELSIHLVAVTRGIGAAAKKHFDSRQPGSSGTLGYFYTLSEAELLNAPFFVGDTDKGKTFVHILDDTGISLLLSELCTPSDFIHYLKSKENAVRHQKLFSSAGEEETLAHYLQGDSGFGFGAFNNPTTNNDNYFAIPEWEWRDYKQTPAYALRYAQKKHAAVWNTIISRFTDSIIDASVGEGHHLPLLTHANAAQVLASENMYSSALLAEALMEKYGSVPETARSSRIQASSSVPGRLYVFLFFPWDKRYISYDEYRSERLSCMKLYAIVAQYKYPRWREILVFGSSTKGSTPGSETIFAMDASIPLTSEERVEAQRIMKQERILDSMMAAETYAALPKSAVGRNAPCPCQSGRKYKKCCMNHEYSQARHSSK